MEEKTPIGKVVDILIDYYGEDKVDMCSCDSDKSIILIYFPKVTVTNEHNRSTEITELYVKLSIDNNGLLIGTFLLNRSEYSVNEWVSDYLHSHVPCIPKSDPLKFKSPCLGSGPIRNTCCTLNTTFDEDLWKLFTLELDKYVHTESVSGTPYKYLENITKPDYSELYINKYLRKMPMNMLGNSTVFRAFIPYLISKRPFSFGFDKRYYIADSDINIIIKTSNLFIEWYNSLSDSEKGTIKDSMFHSDALIRCKIKDGKIFVNISNYHNTDYNNLIGTYLWKFKSKFVKLNIVPSPVREDNMSILVDPDIVMYIVNRMTEVINYKYGRAEITEPSQEEVFI